MDLDALNKGTQDAWNQNAELWDEKMGKLQRYSACAGRTYEFTIDLENVR
jgi:hypothetical protein